MTFSRTVLVAAIVPVFLALGASLAGADTGMLDNGAVLQWPRLFIREGDALKEPSDSETLRTRMNLASCLCSQSNAAVDTDLYYELQLTTTTGTNRAGQIWVGANCEDDIQRAMQCRQVGSIDDIDTFAIRADNIAVRLYDLINASPAQATAACRQADGGEAFVWVIVDTNGDSTPDFFSPRPLDLDKFTDANGFDTQPPPPPENATAAGGENAIEITWKTPESRATDIYGFQALCMDAAGAPVGTGGTPLYSTTETVCGVPQTFDLPASVIVGDEGTAVAAPPAPFAALDPAYICGTVDNGTAQSMTINGLSNDTEYTVALVAVDFYGNAVGTYFSRTVVPRPVTDFWEDVHDRGGKIEGGLCSTSSPASLPGMLLILALPWLWRRRHRIVRGRLTRTATLVGGLAILLVPGRARADDAYPYWDEGDDSSGGLDDGEDLVKWHAGVKLGPYTPDIDNQLGINPMSKQGPYQAMFGNYFLDGKAHDAHVYQVLPTLDVDRIIWRGSGQLGIGGTLGYLQKTAYAYLANTSPDDPRRERSATSKNTFRLIPFAATVTYRATQLDDLYGIPVVPYVRGGLSYYLWWLKGPSGSLAKVCTDGGMETSSCKGDKAYGGTLGFQGSIGLSLRLERIDADAARSMRQSGLNHAGFYGELTYAKVDGFGSDTKLSVGDATWFAGVDFEF
ncbi:MAG: hypothetical protein H6Q90_3105 [Deltaproteobacteria bacterium]|nr:hypothetical protein [Deltaproteobacteria bacterium]